MIKKNDIEERIGAIEEITSQDLSDLQPSTVREYLMVMWPTQKKILEHLEEFNGFKEETVSRMGRLETERKVMYGLMGAALFGLHGRGPFRTSIQNHIRIARKGGHYRG